MRKNIITLISSIIVGIAFGLFSHFELLRKVPGFYCEGFGCMFNGIIYIIIGAILIPLIFGVLGFLLSRQKRKEQAFSSLVISLIIMLLSLGIIHIRRQIVIKKDTEAGHQAKQETYKKYGLPSSQESQSLPLLDNNRAITIANQLTNSTVITIKSPFVVQAYVRDDAVPLNKTMHTAIKKIVSSSTEVKEVGAGKLLPTKKRSTDGRIIFEGTILLEDDSKAASGYLSVTGKDGVHDAIEVTFK